jgi:Pyruvate dehydrogenase complex, dehydrogenase (E1) component
MTELEILHRRLLWLACWTIHNANHLRPKTDGDVKVGGHQASSASMAAILTALYFHALRPEDRVAVKPHAAPVFHAIQYLMGNQTREKLENSGVTAARNPIPRAPRTLTTWISPPARSGWGRRCRSSPRWHRIIWRGMAARHRWAGWWR